MIRVKIHDASNNFLAYAPGRIEPKFIEGLSDPGAGSMKMHIDDPALLATPSMLNYDNLIHMQDEFTGKKFCWKLETKKKSVVSEGERDEMVWEVAGRGAMCLLDEGVVFPEYGVRRESDDIRPFTFASKRSQWYVASEWDAPQYTALVDDISYRAGFPKNWPDKNARWMLPGGSPTSDRADDGTWYYRLEFTTTGTKAFRIFCTADNSFALWLDGDLAMRGSSYKRVYRKTIHLAAGAHVIAVRVRNKPLAQASMRNMAGLLFSMFHLDTDGNRTSVAYRSAPSNGWRGRPALSAPPGWDAGDLMVVLLNEAQARGARGPSLITKNWTGSTDTLGNAWSVKHDRYIDIGTDLLTVLMQLCETHIDARVTDDLKLHLYNQDFGTDRTGVNGVKLYPARDIQDMEYEGDHSGVRTNLLIRTANGWTTKSSANIGSKGRREGVLVVDNAQSDAAAQNVATRAFKIRSVPTETTNTVIQANANMKPWVTFDIGDRVLAPKTDLRTFSAQRVWGISASEDSAANVFYAIEHAE